MKISSKYLTCLVSTLGISSFSLVFLPSVNAEVICKSGTISNHTNGQLYSCILARKVTANVTLNNMNNSIFPCKAEQYVFFNEKGQFQSCVLSEKIKIVQAASVTTCLSEMMVFLSTDSNGKQSVSCRQI